MKKTSSDIVISVKNLKLVIYKHVNLGFKKSLFSLKKAKRVPEAVIKDISFDVKKGEKIGLVGRSGSGKTTLLRILSGIYAPTSGDMKISIDDVTFFNPDVNILPDLSGHDNAYQKASLLGFSRDVIDKKFEKLVSFSELKKVIKKPYKTYSASDSSKLKFSISAFFIKNILFIDSNFDLGRDHFKTKSFNFMCKKIKEKKQTVILTSQRNTVLEDLCDKIIWLEKGKIKMFDKPEVVLPAYEKFMDALKEKGQTKL